MYIHLANLWVSTPYNESHKHTTRKCIGTNAHSNSMREYTSNLIPLTNIVPSLVQLYPYFQTQSNIQLSPKIRNPPYPLSHQILNLHCLLIRTSYRSTNRNCRIWPWLQIKSHELQITPNVQKQLTMEARPGPIPEHQPSIKKITPPEISLTVAPSGPFV